MVTDKEIILAAGKTVWFGIRLRLRGTSCRQGSIPYNEKELIKYAKH